jgi:hypothetical protein
MINLSTFILAINNLSIASFQKIGIKKIKGFLDLLLLEAGLN